MTASLLLLFFTGCMLSTSPRLEVAGAWLPETRVTEIKPGDLNNSCACDLPIVSSSGIVHLTLLNKGGTADRLIGVQSPVAAKAELRQGASDGDPFGAAPLEAVDIPANSQVTFQPGELTIILIGLKQDLLAGEKVMLTLYFEKSPPLTVQAEVRPGGQ